MYVYGFASLPAGKILTYGTGAPPTYLPNGPSPEAPGEMRAPRVGALVCVRATRLEGRVCRCCSGGGRGHCLASSGSLPTSTTPNFTMPTSCASACTSAAPAEPSARCGGGARAHRHVHHTARSRHGHRQRQSLRHAIDTFCEHSARCRGRRALAIRVYECNDPDVLAQNDLLPKLKVLERQVDHGRARHWRRRRRCFLQPSALPLVDGLARARRLVL